MQQESNEVELICTLYLKDRLNFAREIAKIIIRRDTMYVRNIGVQIEQDRLTGSGRPRDRFTHDKLAPGWGPQIRVLANKRGVLVADRVQLAHRCVFCKSKSRFRNCSLPPTWPAFSAVTETTSGFAYVWGSTARRASSGLLNPDLITRFES